MKTLEELKKINNEQMEKLNSNKTLKLLQRLFRHKMISKGFFEFAHNFVQRQIAK